MKFLQLLAQGFDGGGTTHNAKDFCLYVNSFTSDSSEILVNTDEARNIRSIGGFSKDFCSELSFSKDFSEVVSKINASDTIIINNLPRKKVSQTTLDAVFNVLKHASYSGKKIVYFQFHHKSSGMKNEMYTDEKYLNFFSMVDLVVSHSRNTGIFELVDKYCFQIKDSLTREDGIPNMFAMDYDELRRKFWKPFAEKEVRSIRYLGRSDLIKGWPIVRDLHHSCFRNKGYVTYIEGIDRSFMTLDHLFTKATVPRIERDDVRVITGKKDATNLFLSGKYPFERNSPAYILPPYVNEDGLERMSRTQFGINLFDAKDIYLRNIFDNTMSEIIAVGTVPVFRKHWANLFEIGDGSEKHLSDYGEEEIGTILLDEKSPETALEKMEMLAENEELYNTWRRNAYNFYSQRYSTEAVYPRLIKAIKDKLTNPRKKTSNEYDIMEL